MLFRQRSGAAFLWSTQGDAAAGVEVEDGGRRRQGLYRMSRCEEEERRRRRMEDGFRVLFIRRQETGRRERRGGQMMVIQLIGRLDFWEDIKIKIH